MCFTHPYFNVIWVFRQFFHRIFHILTVKTGFGIISEAGKRFLSCFSQLLRWEFKYIGCTRPTVLRWQNYENAHDGFLSKTGRDKLPAGVRYEF